MESFGRRRPNRPTNCLGGIAWRPSFGQSIFTMRAGSGPLGRRLPPSKKSPKKGLAADRALDPQQRGEYGWMASVTRKSDEALRLQKLLLDAVPSADSTYKVVTGTGGSWLRNLLPGLWASGPRILAVGKGETILLSTTLVYRKVKRQLWRGPTGHVRLRSFFGGRVLRLRMPNRRRVQVDGKDDCRAILEAWRTQ